MSNPVIRTAEAARQVFGFGLRCVLVTGDAVRGAVRGLSTLEAQVMVVPELLRAPDAPRLDLALAFRDRLSGIVRPDGFGEVDVRFASFDDYPPERRIPAPGSYRVILGEPPACFHEITPDQLLGDARTHLDNLERTIAEILADVVVPDAALPTVVRRVYRAARPYAYDAAVVLTSTPFRVWASELGAVAPVVESCGMEDLVAFLEDVTDWPRRHHDPLWLRARLDQGVRGLYGVASWWSGSRERLLVANA
ncbi:MAG TPA: hypothetical protein VI076_08290 [Actinopolymorphaceae bacterium]